MVLVKMMMIMFMVVMMMMAMVKTMKTMAMTVHRKQTAWWTEHTGKPPFPFFNIFSSLLMMMS